MSDIVGRRRNMLGTPAQRNSIAAQVPACVT
jgi:hypothetical protein